MWTMAGAVLAAALAAAPVRAQGAVDSTVAPVPSAAAAASAVATPVPAAIDSSAAGAPSADAAAPTTLNPRIVGHRKVRLDRGSHNVVRSGPGGDFAIVGVYPKGAEFTVIARSGEWYDVQVSPTETGWIHSSLCHEFDDMSDLEFRPNPKLFTRTGTFIFGGYLGAYAFDRKSNSLVMGGKLGYYVFDRVQVEGSLSYTHVHRPAEIVESLFGLTLEAEDFGMLFYNLNVTFEILPGRQMVPFVVGGVGSAIMQGESEPSYNLGAGTTLYLSKRMATRWEVRDYRFSTGPKASRVANDNVEFSLGTMVLF
jgi:outer membrane beta-barrel protein